MDILHLVDRLEELFNESRPIWFTHSVAMDEDRLLDLIDQMRVSIPEEIKKAQQIMAQRDRYIAQAQEEAARIVAQAREKHEQLTEREPVTQAAQTRADQIVAQSRIEAERVRQEADEYVLDSLTKLETELEKMLTQARNGIRALEVETKGQYQVNVPQRAGGGE